jgi:uncharacterized protein YdeI (YjbR/CyaY-like superfamily)
MEKKEVSQFYPPTKAAWREWLQLNHDKEQAVWLIMYRKKSGVPSISWSEAVDEALCYGWIDSVANKIDDEKFKQFFSRRKPVSTWSKVNKIKIEKLSADGLMMPAGLAIIEVAKANGSWTILDEVEELLIPEDLDLAFEQLPGSKEFFLSHAKSVRKPMLQWIVLAKRPETRLKRIQEIALLSSQGLKPKPF